MKDRAQSLKFKTLLRQKHTDLKTDADIKKLELKERHLAMLQVHNSKIDKVMDKYRVEVANKKEAKEKGITLKELEAEKAKTEEKAPGSKKFKKGKKAAATFDFEIMVKDEDG